MSVQLPNAAKATNFIICKFNFIGFQNGRVNSVVNLEYCSSMEQISIYFLFLNTNTTSIPVKSLFECDCNVCKFLSVENFDAPLLVFKHPKLVSKYRRVSVI